MFTGIVSALAALSIFAMGAAALLLILLLVPPARGQVSDLLGGRPPLALGIAFVVAVICTVGSLYLSSSGLEPCRFCWYQRIAMYPLVPLIGLALVRRDAEVWRYILALSLPGLALSIYHISLQWQPALEVVECSATAPCSMRYFLVYGFVSIPVMAGAGFLLISALAAAAGVSSARATARAESSDQNPTR